MEEEYIYKIFVCTYSGDNEKANWFQKQHNVGWELVCPEIRSVSNGYSYGQTKYIFRKKVINSLPENKEEI